MNSGKNKRQQILDQPSYWIEGINNYLYNAIMDFMEEQGMNRTQLAKHLGISKGRVSQILNDGEINFSIEKIVQLSLLLNKYPQFELIEKEDYIKEKEGPGSKTITVDYLNTEFYNIVEETYDGLRASNNKQAIPPYAEITITQELEPQL